MGDVFFMGGGDKTDDAKQARSFFFVLCARSFDSTTCEKERERVFDV